MRDLCSFDSNSTRTELDSGLISTSKPGFGVAHSTSRAVLEKEIAVVPPTRLNVRTCAVDVVDGATVVDDVDDVDAAGLSGTVVAAVEPVVDVGASVVAPVSSERASSAGAVVGATCSDVSESAIVALLAIGELVSTDDEPSSVARSATEVCAGAVDAPAGGLASLTFATWAAGGATRSSSTSAMPAKATETAAMLPSSHNSTKPTVFMLKAWHGWFLFVSKAP